MPRTSATHPLYMDSLPLARGQIGITICPGKQGKSYFGEPWARDLTTDMKAITAWGATTVLTLVQGQEMADLGVAELPNAVRKHGMTWHHLPIQDLQAPDAQTLEKWQILSPQLHKVLEDGGKVLIHCRGGLGRAGTIAALLLIERGMAPDDAISIRAWVRATLKGICNPPAIVHHALLRWLHTQGGHTSIDIGEVGLVADPRLHFRRAPGNTCLSGLRQARHLGDTATNDSKGCGTIMRVAPVAFWAARGEAV